MKLMTLFEASQTLTLYHGAKERFDQFDPAKINPNGFGRGMGFHFVNDMSLAKQYAGEDGFVYVADISVSNPLVYGEEGSSGPGLSREKVVGLGYDSFMFKERGGYIELIVWEPSQINLKNVIDPSNAHGS